jgi:hypothetical protein
MKSLPRIELLAGARLRMVSRRLQKHWRNTE